MRLHFFIFSLLVPLICFGQTILQGHVIDGITKQPLEAANVFVSNSTYKTITNSRGLFFLQIPSASYQVAVSHMGYAPVIIQSNAFSDLSKRYTIELFPETEQLRSVAILSAKTRASYLKIFKDALVGKSRNGVKTQILNLDDVNLEPDENGIVLEVSSEQPLIIENPELNYRITFILAYFQINLKTGVSIYSGYPSFDDIIPMSAQNSKRIINNRLRAYRGSVMHLVRSLYSNDFHQQGYIIDAFSIRPNPMFSETLHAPARNSAAELSIAKPHVIQPRELTIFTKRHLTASDLLVERDGKIYLRFDEYLQITYKLEKDEPNYKYVGHKANRLQVSQLKSLIPEIEIFPSGNYANPDKLVLHGYMGWEKLADLVPFDYIPMDAGQ